MEQLDVVSNPVACREHARKRLTENFKGDNGEMIVLLGSSNAPGAGVFDVDNQKGCQLMK
jgi:NAD(P)H-hydrate repair Nnr-like enzyme with NAD(P)H-hydrate dehydratase domain